MNAVEAAKVRIDQIRTPGGISGEIREGLVYLESQVQKLSEQRTALVAKLTKLHTWLTRLAERSENDAKATGFESMRAAYVADAKNYRATAVDIQAAIDKAVD